MHPRGSGSSTEIVTSIDVELKDINDLTVKWGGEKEQKGIIKHHEDSKSLGEQVLIINEKISV